MTPTSQVSSEWVPFHASLTRGDKRSLPRAVRFVFLELSLHARRKAGLLPLPRGFKNDVDAVHDILGGKRSEIVDALALLTVAQDPSDPEDEPLIFISGPRERRVLTVVSHQNYVKQSGSAARMRELRKRRNEESQQHASDGDASHRVPVTSPVTVTETPQRREEKRTEEPPVVPRGGFEPEQPEPDERPAVPVDVGTATSFEATETYAAAIREATGAGFAMPRFGVRELVSAINGHCPRDYGVQRMLEWLALNAARYVADRPRAQSEAGYQPKKFLDWCNGGETRSLEHDARSRAELLEDLDEPDDEPVRLPLEETIRLAEIAAAAAVEALPGPARASGVLEVATDDRKAAGGG